MNAERNRQYARQAKNDGKLDMPVLSLHGNYDYTCETVSSHLADPMRNNCRNLTEEIIQSGHWMAQEKPVEVNAAITKWLATALAGIWELGPCGLHYEGRTVKAVPRSCAPIPELVKARSEPVGTLVPISAFG